MADQQELPLPSSTTWKTPKGKHTCKRDPNMGPGTCWHWWEGCPNAEKRGCYLLWLKQAEQANPTE
ncbi:MAG TPA: hypothetical protein VK181_04435 [Rhizobium sp.]|nr:hypothetical protein [Rhizobium sp.]